MATLRKRYRGTSTLLTVHDQQLVDVPRHLHEAASKRILQFAAGNAISLIPAADNTNEGTPTTSGPLRLSTTTAAGCAKEIR